MLGFVYFPNIVSGPDAASPLFWTQMLKHRLVESGLDHVQIVAADAIGSNAWDIAKDFKQDEKLKEAVDIIG